MGPDCPHWPGGLLCGMRRTLLLLSLSLAACDAAPADTPTDALPPLDQAADAGPDAEVTYHRDIAPLLEGYCLRCHAGDGGAAHHFAFDDYRAVRAHAALIAHVTAERSMPPFLAAPAVRPLSYDASLSPEQIALIRRWVDLGAPEGDPAQAGPPIEVPLGRLSRVDHTLAMPEPFTPTFGEDIYRCFVIPWDGATAYITGLNVRPGNLSVTHHAVIYLVDAPYADRVDQAAGADGQPGYDCFGGATPPETEAFPTKIVAGWAPGEEGHDFPTGTGVRIDAGARIVLQMHYSTLAMGAQPDQSAVELRLDAAVEKNAGNLPWLNPEWLGDAEAMRIPAGDNHVVHEYSARPIDSPLLGDFLPGVDPTQGLDLHSVLPHLHTLGTRIDLDVERADGTIEPLVHIPRWDFNWQAYYTFAEPVRLGPEDRIRMHCEWDNSVEHQPVIDGVPRRPRDVSWGESTYDEMCAAAFYVTGVAQGSAACADVGSVSAPAGRFALTFDATEAVRTSARLDGPLSGVAEVAVYRAEDVILTGPLAGREPVAGLSLELDLTAGPAGPFVLDTELPAGDYQVLGFMDNDGNAAGGGPDQNDPVIIPGTRYTLECAEQPITARFSLLLP